MNDIKILAELLCVVVVLVDMSGFLDEMKGRIRKWLGVRGEISLKPLDCSFCMFHWTALVWMIWIGRLNLETYTAICLGCLLTMPVKGLLSFILDGLNRLFIWRW